MYIQYISANTNRFTTWGTAKLNKSGKARNYNSCMHILQIDEIENAETLLEKVDVDDRRTEERRDARRSATSFIRRQYTGDRSSVEIEKGVAQKVLWFYIVDEAESCRETKIRSKFVAFRCFSFPLFPITVNFMSSARLITAFAVMDK